MREETVMSLKWHSFPSHLALSLDTCYEKQQFVDLSLVCKDGTILKCHKMVLANSSSFFRRLLVANDHPHPMIILHDIEADDLKTIINFMYCGEIQVVQSEVRRLLELAEILQVTGLRHIQTSVLVAEANNADATTRRTPTYPGAAASTASRLEDRRTKASQSSGSCAATAKAPLGKPSARLPSSLSSNNPAKTRSKTAEAGINLLNQRFETGRSGISIVDVNNEAPSTSRGIPPRILRKRRSEDERADDQQRDVISWPRILSAISKDKPLPLKKLCIMDEVEITAGKPKRNEPLDRRKFDHQQTMKCAVFIKDEVDISSDVEVQEEDDNNNNEERDDEDRGVEDYDDDDDDDEPEDDGENKKRNDVDEDTDPLEVQELESTESILRTGQIFSYASRSFGRGNLSEFPKRKGS